MFPLEKYLKEAGTQPLYPRRFSAHFRNRSDRESEALLSTGKASFLLPGILVEVRPWYEIQATLDENGFLEGVPFMPEMLEFCGKRFLVSKRLERTCEETQGKMRRIRNAVFLDGLRCEGTAHDGCNKGCMIFWKEPWLRRVDGQPFSKDPHGSRTFPEFSYRCKSSDGRYVCQSTELVRATSHLSPLDLGVYLRDIQAGTYSFGQLAKNLIGAWWLRLWSKFRGKSHLVLQGRQSTSSSEALNLRAGEWVKVRTKDEIIRTLDRQGKNRGLAFTVEMLRFCGGKFQVLRRVERMIHDPTCRMINLQDTVILNEVICDGCHSLRGGCPRANFLFWRETWLERVDSPHHP